MVIDLRIMVFIEMKKIYEFALVESISDNSIIIINTVVTVYIFISSFIIFFLNLYLLVLVFFCFS